MVANEEKLGQYCCNNDEGGKKDCHVDEGALVVNEPRVQLSQEVSIFEE